MPSIKKSPAFHFPSIGTQMLPAQYGGFAPPHSACHDLHSLTSVHQLQLPSTIGDKEAGIMGAVCTLPTVQPVKGRLHLHLRDCSGS